MTLVRILTEGDAENMFLRLTPGRKGRWGDIQITLDDVERVDYLIVINRVSRDTTVECPPENIWSFNWEPPEEMFDWYRTDYRKFHRVFIPYTDLKGSKYVHTQPALPWEVDKDYDFLKAAAVPEKPKTLSWITSNKSTFAGHQLRMAFLDQLRNAVELDLWGHGFEFIEDKWDGIAPYKYSLAIENYQSDYWWTEKIADCFLSFAMPIQFGCTNIDEYFPRESYIEVDINKPAEAIEIVKDAIKSDLWEKNLDAIIHARELILDKYQLMPLLSEHIKAAEATNPARESKVIHLPELDKKRARRSLTTYVSNKIRRTAQAIRNGN